MKRKSFKTIKLLVALGAALCLMSACGGASPEDNAVPSAASDKAANNADSAAIEGGGQMTDIKITVKDKKATLTGVPAIVCENSDYTATKLAEGSTAGDAELFIDTETVINGNMFDNQFNGVGYIDISNGNDASSDSMKKTDRFYPFKKGTLYFVASETVAPMVFLFYDENKQYLGYHSFNGVTQGQYAVPFDGYFKAYTDKNYGGSIYFSTNVPNEPIDYSYTIANKIVTNRKKLTIVNLGDSIFGNVQNYTSVSAQLEKLRGDTVFNCGFGGCRMSVNTTNWNECSMYKIADCIYNDDFTNLVALTTSGNWDDMPNYFDETAKLLSEIDFSEVDAITISYGTNDYREETSTLDNESNPFDTTTVCGALRYSIKQIQNKHPHIKLLVTTPIFRTFLDDNNAATSNSDTKDWGSGTLLEYAEAIKNACKEMKVPCLDLQNESQFNEFTRLYYYPVDDGTHPNEKGREQIAMLINGKLRTILK